MTYGMMGQPMQGTEHGMVLSCHSTGILFSNNVRSSGEAIARRRIQKIGTTGDGKSAVPNPDGKRRKKKKEMILLGNIQI